MLVILESILNLYKNCYRGVTLWEWQGLIFDHQSGEKEPSTLRWLDLAPTMDAG